MAIVVDSEGFLHELDDEILRLKDLMIHLKRLRAGQRPLDGDLAKAPLVDSYQVTLRPTPCLSGYLYNHPKLRTSTVITSELVTFAPHHDWARTRNRLYRLGRQDRHEA